MATFDGPAAPRLFSHHIQMQPFHEPATGVPLGMQIPVPPMHHSTIPFQMMAPAPESAIIINQMKPMVANSAVGAAPAAQVNDPRPIVPVPEDLYSAVMDKSDTNIPLDDMVSVCSQCGLRNVTMDLKWTNAKARLKCMEQFIQYLSPQVIFKPIPSQSAPMVPGPPPISQSVMCPPQPQHQSDLYTHNLKSNLSATAQEFRPIQTHKQANLHHEDQLHQPPYNSSAMTTTVVTSSNKDMYLTHNNNTSNNNNNNSNNNNNVVNNDDSKLPGGISPSEPLDINDSGTLESGIDSGVHDSGVSDSGVTDPTVPDSTPDRFPSHADDPCNVCESDSLKNEKDGKRKAKKRRPKLKTQKSEDGSTDNLLCDGENDYSQSQSQSTVASDLHNAVGRNNTNNAPSAPGAAATATGPLSNVSRHRSGSHGGKGAQQPSRGGHVVNDTAPASGGGAGPRQHPKPQRNSADNKRPSSRNNNYPNRDDTHTPPASAADKRNGIERDRSIPDRNERIPGPRGPRNSAGPMAISGGRRSNNTTNDTTMNNCDVSPSPAHRAPQLNRRSNNGNGSPYPFGNKKYGIGHSNNGSGASSSTCSNSSGAGSAGGGNKSSFSGYFYREVEGNLFTVSEDYSLAHCVAEDLRMGAGIAVHFKKEFSGVGELLDQRKKVGQVAVLSRGNRYIFYLITKPQSNVKPNLHDMRRTLVNLREECAKLDVKKLAMPRIGCGLDRLSWRDVRDVLQEVFSQTEIEILIYNFKEDEESFDSSFSHSKNSSTGSSSSSSPAPKAPPIRYRAHSLVDIEPLTALVVFGTSTGFMDKTCQLVNSHPKQFTFQKQYQEQCRKMSVGEVIEIKTPNPDYYVYVLLVRENESAPFSFKNLESCALHLNAKLKKAQFGYVAFDAIDDPEDSVFTDKIVSVFRNHIYFGIEIYVCNDHKNNANVSVTSTNASTTIVTNTTNNSSNAVASADRDRDRDHSSQQQHNSSNSSKFNTTRRS